MNVCAWTTQDVNGLLILFAITTGLTLGCVISTLIVLISVHERLK